MDTASDKIMRRKSFRKSTDHDLQYLVNEAYRILGNPIILCDLDWKILVFSQDAVTDDPIWNHHMQNGNIHNDVKDFFLSQGFPDTMSNAKPIVYLQSENLKYDRLIAKLYDNDGIVIAFATIVACNKPIDDDDFAFAKDICKEFAKKIIAMEYYKNYGRKKLAFYINSLIDDDVVNDEYSRNFIELIYRRLKEHLYIAVVDISQCNPTLSDLDYYKNLFWKLRPAFKYSIYANYIIIIMSANEKISYPKKIFHRLNKIIEEKNMRVGISGRFENLFDLRRYYDQAVTALQDGMNKNDGQKIFTYYDKTEI